MLNFHKEFPKSQLRFVVCDCDKKETIQLGLKIYGYLTLFLLYPVTVLFLFLSIFFIYPLGIVASVGFILMVEIARIPVYKRYKREMLNAGHTTKCSKKVARQGTLYSGYAEFKILGKEEK